LLFGRRRAPPCCRAPSHRTAAPPASVVTVSLQCRHHVAPLSLTTNILLPFHKTTKTLTFSLNFLARIIMELRKSDGLQEAIMWVQEAIALNILLMESGLVLKLFCRSI